MGCINSSFEGYCKLSSEHSPCMGCDTDAYDPDRDEYECAVENDEEPKCEDYESDQDDDIF